MSEVSSSPMGVGETTPGHKKNGLGGPEHRVTQGPAWFDVRVFYVRAANCHLDDTPDVLTMRYPPRDIGTALEVNGGRISPSEELKLTLRRDRLDTDSSEATYVSTDHFRATGTVFFEVYDKEVVLLSGTFERSDERVAKEDDRVATLTVEKSAGKIGWRMDLTCAVTSAACSFLKGRIEFSATGVVAPTMEVTVVGRYLGSAVTLSEIVPLSVRRKVKRKHALHPIVEVDEGDNFPSDLLLTGQPDQVPGEGVTYGDLTDKTYGEFSDLYTSDGSLINYGEGEDGELSWFNAGVRVGVGLGLGMCLGVGIGIGLLVRTYQATTRTFRRNIF
jgi:hypothetical protein